MLGRLYDMVMRAPLLVIFVVLLLTAFFAAQLTKLRWETDARVYMPKGHPAIIYDEKIEHLFGAKDAVVIAVMNETDGIFNPQTLARIARVTAKVAALEGVIANRLIDVASLSTANLFEGDEVSIGTRRLMPKVPETDEEIAELKSLIYNNADLFVGNLVSADGKAAMIRAKLKEGADTRYMTYFAIRRIISEETGDWSWSKGWWSGEGGWESNQWQKEDAAATDTETASPTKDAWNGGDSAQSNQWQKWQSSSTTVSEPVRDSFFLAGRPVIEVTSGMEAMSDLQKSIPLLLAVIAAMLFVLFRTLRGVCLPLFVMAASIVWTMGTMALLDVPMYTISTMLPVILVAVGIGDGIHLLSNYYDNVLRDPHRPGADIMREVMSELGAPLITTSLTTAIGFLSLWFAEMPPFKVFGLFTMLGIGYCWILSVTFLPAVLTKLKPKVGGYLQKRRSMRVREEQGMLAKMLVVTGQRVTAARKPLALVVGVLLVASAVAATQLQVNSSWMSDFRPESELRTANDLINKRFSGTVTLNVVVDGKRNDALKSPELLKAIEELQAYAESLPHVGDSLSVVDYLKSMNKNLHAGDKAFEVLPHSREQIAEYLFLFSISGRPEELDEVADFGYQVANVAVQIKSDYTHDLKAIIDDLQAFIAQRFSGLDVDVNLAGAGNNAYIWAQLLIDSQTTAILLSKLGILLLALILFRSVFYAFLVVVPVSMTTLLIAGASGLLVIPLDVSTALAAGVAIGVGVDYAVHYLFAYRRARRHHLEHAQATASAMRGVGRTIVFNAAVVTAGFSVLLFSLFPPHVKLGAFVTVYMVLSCVVALTVLPMLFSFASSKSASGEDPSEP